MLSLKRLSILRFNDVFTRPIFVIVQWRNESLQGPRRETGAADRSYSEEFPGVTEERSRQIESTLLNDIMHYRIGYM